MKIAIIGAGLGGLVAATLLSKAGHSVIVFERQPTLSRQGGIIALRPSALRVLYDAGLKAQIDAASTPLGESHFAVLLTGEVVRKSDLREEGALSRVTVRPTLAGVLFDAAVEAGVRVVFGRAVKDFDEGEGEVKIQCEDGEMETADLVLVADGIRSRLRGKILEDQDCEPIVTDATFYVFRLPAQGLPEDVRERMSDSDGSWIRMTAWLGKDSWAMSAYDPVDDAMNLGLTIVEPTNQTSLWDEDGDVGYVLEHFKTRACHDILETLKSAKSCDRWRLAYMPSLPRWSSKGGRVALLGDAAHAILPNGGAGITLTIEDVGALDHLLTPEADVPRILRLWEKACKPRADKLREFGLFNMRRLQGDAEVLAETERSLKEEAPYRLDAKPDMDAPFSTLGFARWLSGYDPIDAIEEAMKRDQHLTG